jgi:hypothetical protein
VGWLVDSQNGDGGFGVARSSASDSDMTGAALQALATVGRRNSAASRRAVDWLTRNQNDDGGFGQFRGRPSNAQSTSYAVQGLLAARAGGGTVSRARAYLVRLQRRDGSVGYSSASAQTPVWVTAQALMALEGKALPLATVPRSKRARASASATGGSGGASAKGGGGKSGGSKPGASGAEAAEAGGVGGATALGESGALPPAGVEPEGTTAEALAAGTSRTAATRAEEVPVWAGVLAALLLVGLLWALHAFVLPRRADVG